MEQVSAIVIGAGVVGLAVARALALAGHAPLIVEGEPHIGSWTSSRNSEVIHAGLYYPEGSLKARLCVEGRDELYAFCAARGVPHRRLGKLIFAHEPEQSAALDTIQTAAQRAGVHDLQRLSRAEAGAIEPAIDCADAVFSPSTGIVDSHALMLALLGEAEAHGATLATHSVVKRISRAGGLWRLHLDDDAAPVSAPILINAAGLHAQRVAGTIEGLDKGQVSALHLARGVYFAYSGPVPFSHLIYPVPEPGGLGTHLTLDLAGQARFGPDLEWIDTIDYTVDPGRREAFARAARRIWPAIDVERLQPGYAGIRPKLSGPGEPAADFVIAGPADHGLAGLVNLFGIESPGLTASLAIARMVAGQVA